MIFFLPWVRTFAVINHTSKIALALITVLTLSASLLLSAGDAAAQTSSSWTYCSSEGGQCNFSGTREVRYGANGNYSYGVFSNGVSCNNGVFGDPIYGTAKNCEYGGTSQSSSPNPTPPSNNSSWNYCASEGGQCNFSGTREVRYGANGNYAYGMFSNGVSCNNGVFGDPIYGTAKNCEYGGTSQSSSPNPTPPSNNSSWNYCASEGGQCNFSGTREVRYGANGNYAYGIFSNAVSCNNGVFGDPIHGFSKQCEYSGDASTSTSSAVTVSSTWNDCAGENQQCTFNGTKQVRYGGNGSYFYGSFTNSVNCSNAIFGDPAPGYGKRCSYSEIITEPSTGSSSPPSNTSSGSGHIFYVATNGNDSNTCAQAQNQSTARNTIQGGINCMASGDTLLIKSGTYSRPSTLPPSGTSWDNSTKLMRYGTDQVTVLGWPGFFGPRFQFYYFGWPKDRRK